MAFRWSPPTLLRVACVLQAVPLVFCTFIGLSRDASVAATLFGISTCCFLVAGAGAWTRTLTTLGAAAMLAALTLIVATDGAGLDYALFLGAPAVCTAGMAYVRVVQTKQSVGSVPSSARSS